jgi:tetratricopeptide (TPR) repeat protein
MKYQSLKMMSGKFKFFQMLLVMLAVTGCTTGSVKQQSSITKGSLENPLLYNVMIAEIAGHRGDLKRSVDYYEQVIDVTTDLDIIRRAARIMLFAENYPAANRAVNRWLEIAPDDIEARQMATSTSLREGDVDSAVMNLEWLLARAKDRHQGFNLIMALLERVPDKLMAMAAMVEMSSRYPEIIEGHIYLARLAYAAEQYETAVSAATDAIRLDDSSPDAHISLARAQIELGNTDEALKALAQLLVNEPENTELRLTYARMLMTVNRFESAIAQFEILLEDQPGNGDLLYSTALLYLQVRSYASAETKLKKLLELGEHRQEAWYYLGRLEEKRKRYDEAREWYARVDNTSLYIDAQMAAARVQGKAGGLEEARERYRVLRESNPDNAVTIWLSESEMLREMEEYEAAYELLNAALSEYPDDTDLRYSRALAAERVDRIDILESDLKMVLEKEPDHAHALNALGYTLADRTKRYKEALGYISRAHELEPNDPAIIDSLGWVHYRLGNYDQAIAYLTRANEVLRDGEVAAHLGEVLWVTGNREAADALWQEALRENPDSKILLRAIKRFKP